MKKGLDMRNYAPDKSVIVGQMQKGRTEIVQVLKTRLSGVEYTYAPVFCIGGSKSEKGLCLTDPQWDELFLLVQKAKAIVLPKANRNMPAMKKTSETVYAEPDVKPGTPSTSAAPKRVPLKNKPARKKPARKPAKVETVAPETQQG